MSILFKKSYWHFLSKSTNAHGVHSPFVYDLVTLCFYKKINKPFNLKDNGADYSKSFSDKHKAILNDFITYSDISKIKSDCDASHLLKSIVSKQGVSTTENTSDAELIYFSKGINFCNDLNSLKHNGILVVEKPYENPLLWSSLKKLDFAHIVVDTYFFGFIFNRKQQAKETFYIRI